MSSKDDDVITFSTNDDELSDEYSVILNPEIKNKYSSVYSPTPSIIVLYIKCLIMLIN